MRIPSLLVAGLFALSAPAMSAPPSSIVTRTDDGYLMGNPKAPVKLVVLSAYGCPHCRLLDATMIPALKRDWIDTGKVSFRYVPYGMFPTDVPAMFLAECGPTVRFFDRSSRIFAMQQKTTSTYARASDDAKKELAAGSPADVPRGLASLSALDRDSVGVGVRTVDYARCLASPEIRRNVSTRQKVIEGRYKFTGTPAVWINGRPAGTGSSWPKLEAILRTMIR